ncbi:tyrosine phosphatase [Kitasatospora cheerisanensis KCTC 2395]|uniref:Tyrosine phosphatase n=1 Tax=Kitasatospora cheerisanensis KCTC 2395 TaxID=1348663 RepID=A0A066Z9Z1_9ACTN|nr:tyrosine phosphatase [Kitasatospora cheerisanensis KCTC 2395]
MLILDGMDGDTAWERIARRRGLAVPDTAEQRAWTTALPV